MKKIFALASMLLLLSCNGQSSGDVERLAPAEFAAKMKAENNAQILDVRTPEEYSGGHIEQSQNLNWNAADFESRAAKLDKSKPVFVYCKIGGRSKQAADKLSGMGFKVYDLKGGFMKWESEGFAEKSDSKIGMTRADFDKLTASDKPVLITFNAKWCEPCKRMKPFVDKMAAEMKDKVTIIRLDADENKTLVKEMGIDMLPTLQLHKNGRIAWQHQGYIGEEDLKKQLP